MLKKIMTAILTAAFLISVSVGTTVEARSLWADSQWGMFADKKARDVGDILTIIINESTIQTASKSRSNSKEADVDLKAGTGIFRFLAAASAGGSDSFKADGSARDTNSFNGRITVTVVEVLPNENMVVEGTQSIWQNKDEHKITIRGIVRRADVTAYNTILSTQVADATLRFDGKGPLNAKQRQGILTQVFNFLF